MNVACTSKRINNFVPRATTYEDRAAGTIIRVLHMGRSTHTKYEGTDRKRGRLGQLVNHLQRRIMNNPNFCHQYQHASMEDYQEFRFNIKGGQISSKQYKALVHAIQTSGPKIVGITSLDFCSSTTATTSFYSKEKSYVLKIISYLLPSLREVDFTNMFVGPDVVELFFENCSCLEKLTFKNKFFACGGSEFKDAKNLKQLYMDDSHFCTDERNCDAYSNLENEVVSNEFLLHDCSSKVLERVSMRNAKMYVNGKKTSLIPAIPQKALMKFILNAPRTLRWFRSDLTPENIKIVQRERPDIEFVS